MSHKSYSVTVQLHSVYQYEAACLDAWGAGDWRVTMGSWRLIFKRVEPSLVVPKPYYNIVG